MSVSIDATERDWAMGLNNSKDQFELLEFVNSWMPYVKDALEIVKQMDEKGFLEFKEGLKKERRGSYSGDEWNDKYGAVLVPEDLIVASMLAKEFTAPLLIMLEKIMARRTD